MRRALDLLLPPACVACGREGAPLCDRCARPLARRLDEPPGSPLGLVAPLPRGILQLEWCAAFEGPVRDALHALKYRGERRLAPVLGRAMAERWRRAARGGDILVPVPVHPDRRRDRGFDQAEDLAKATAAVLGLPWTVALERRTRTMALHTLGRTERVANLRGAFGVRSDRRDRIVGRWVVLVDDTLTTGATLTECAAALRTAGVPAVSGLTVARDR